MSEYDIPLCMPERTKEALAIVNRMLGKGE
jgi:hypothetical protein